MRVEGSAFILGLVERGLGYTILPKHSVVQSPFARKLQLNEIVSPGLKWTLSLGLSKEHRITDLIKHTAEISMDVLRKDLKD